MIYVKVEDSTPLRIVSKPDWFDDEGEPISDQWLIENESIYPVAENINRPPLNNPLYEQVIVNNISDWALTPNNVIMTYTLSTKSLEEFKDEYKDKVKNIRKDYVRGGMSFIDSNTNTLRIHTDKESRSNLSSIYIAIKNSLRTDDALWKTMDGFFNISNTDMEAICVSVMNFIQECYDKEKETIDIIMQQNDFIDVYNLDLYDGWPTNSLLNSGS